jgi:hypothetical protein
MYSPLIVDRRLAAAKKSGLAFRRLPRETCIEVAAKLELLRRGPAGQLLPEGQFARPLLKFERDFIDSETLLCKCDFGYWAQRYAQIEVDPGVIPSDSNRPTAETMKIGAATFLPSQHRFLAQIGRREQDCHAEKKKYGFTEGIRVYAHKVRQVCITQTWLELMLHRMIFWPGTRSYAASLDAPRVSEIFKRFHLMLDRLPFWLQPKVYPDVKDTEIGFEEPIASRAAFEAENAEHGIGTGSQNDISALTEVALWRYPSQIRFSFVPSIPKAVTTLHVQESTSNVKGDYWNEVTEAARHKRRGYEIWVYCFIPWYMNFDKYRANVPDDWTPEEHTERHAELIERTSPEWFDGRTVRPNRSQLYWWETTRHNYAKSGELASFLASYPATPEQSFQNVSQGALPVELLEKMETRVMPGHPYDMEIAA